MSFPTAGERHKIRVEYMELTGNASLALQCSVNRATTVDIPAGQFTPDYGLVTSSTTDDAAPTGSGLSNSQVPAMATSTGYGLSPWLGLATASTVDPNGLALTTSATFEAPGGNDRWQRPKTRTLPSGSATTTTLAYYKDVDKLSATTCGVPVGTHQWGYLKTSTSPTSLVTMYILLRARCASATPPGRV